VIRSSRQTFGHALRLAKTIVLFDFCTPEKEPHIDEILSTSCVA